MDGAKLRFERFRRVSTHAHARAWLTWQSNRGLAANTVEAYGWGLERYLLFLEDRGLKPESATRHDIAGYVRHLLPAGAAGTGCENNGIERSVSNSTLQQRVTVIRLFHDYLVEEQICARNPVRLSIIGSAGRGVRGLVPRHRKLPWVPTDEQWLAVLEVARSEPFRNRVMLALAYDCALRREELCGLHTDDIDPAYRLIRIRAENTKGRRERVVPYSEPTGELYRQYLGHRRQLSRERGRLFLSESRRNRCKPISIWTWSKVIAGLADGSGVQSFKTHTPRHLSLTDLARAGWDLHEIAMFAGHRSVQTTLLYIHLSGRDLAAKLRSSMSEIHTRRASLTAERLS